MFLLVSIVQYSSAAQRKELKIYTMIPVNLQNNKEMDIKFSSVISEYKLVCRCKTSVSMICIFPMAFKRVHLLLSCLLPVKLYLY